jgi:hypothetical protein
MDYLNYQYLYPPRPDVPAPVTMLNRMGNNGYISQIKKNGQNSVIAISPDKKIITRNRHNAEHLTWKPDYSKMQPFLNLKGKGWYVFVAELLNSKVAGLRDINYVHDVLVNDGEYLVGYTQAERQMMLHSMFNTRNFAPTYSHHVIDPTTWVVREHQSGFRDLFDSLDKPEDEGLVFKNPQTPLQFCNREKSNNAGMLKIRRTHKNYSF